MSQPILPHSFKLSFTKTDWEPFLAAVQLMHRHGQKQYACELLFSLASLHILPAEFLPTLGSWLQESGAIDKALFIYQQARQHLPKDIHVRTNMGELLIQQTRYLEAATILKEAVDLDLQKQHPAAHRARLLILQLKDRLFS